MALTLKPLSLSSGFVLSEFASEFGPGASAHRFTKTQSECHWASALRLMNNPGLQPVLRLCIAQRRNHVLSRILDCRLPTARACVLSVFVGENNAAGTGDDGT